MFVEPSVAFGSRAFDALPGHVAVLDRGGVIRLTNRAWNRFALDNGYGRCGCGIGLSYLDICERTRGRDAAVALEVANGLHRLLRGDEERFSLARYECSATAGRRWFAIEARPLPHGGAVVMHVDITTVVACTEQYRDATLTDPLTGLVTRPMLEDRLAQCMHAARDLNHMVGFVILDLQNLAEVNASIGRDAGDELLRRIGARIRARTRSSDTVARLGGGEFAAVLTNLRGPADLDLWQAMVLTACQMPVPAGGRDLLPRLALGAAAFPGDAHSPAALIATARRRCYAADAVVPFALF